MQLPLFFIPESPVMVAEFELSEDTSRHISTVLRMKESEELQLTDGKGNLYTARIIKPHKKHTTIQVTNKQFTSAAEHSYTVAVALLKNTARFEWFLEKATELGITRIIPLITTRTEKTHYKEERSKSILVSAMMQSGQTWLPELMSPQRFESYLAGIEADTTEAFFIAHCMDKPREYLANALLAATHHRKILIGPEGDFTPDELEMAIQKGAIPVSLGNSRLRAETAAIVAATLIKLINPPFVQ